MSVSWMKLLPALVSLVKTAWILASQPVLKSSWLTWLAGCGQITSPLFAPSPCLLMEVVMVSACLSVKASATFYTIPFYISAAVINHPLLLSKGEVRPVILRTPFLPRGRQNRGALHLPAPRSGAVGHDPPGERNNAWGGLRSEILRLASLLLGRYIS